MQCRIQAILALMCTLLFLFLHPVQAQVLRSTENDPNTPFYSDVRPQPTAQLNATIKRMHLLVLELRQSKLSPAEKQAALDELIRDHDYILRQHHTWLDWQQPQTVDSAAEMLERMEFEEAAELAPTEKSREQVLRNAPEHLELDPNDPRIVETYHPPLLAPVQKAGNTATGRQSPKQADTPTVPEPPATPSGKLTARGAVQLDAGSKVKVTVLADEKTTTDMHEDNTALRDVTDAHGELVLFGTIHLWAGGAIQLDTYHGDGLFTQDEGGDSKSKSYVRRGEGILRASVLENSEIKVQYDFDTRKFRNLYWRWLSESASRSLTVGNQKEPMGLDYLVGSKFTTAMEPSAPSSAFGSYRSAGIRYSGWTTLESREDPIQLWGDSSTFVTSSIGLFGKDIENTNDTDWAVTGRLSMGARKTERTGFQLAASASYRHGEYDRIAPRPGLQDVSRITLAQPEADTQAVLGLEAMYGTGSLHSQVELYYSDYSGGEIDADGWGGYGQVGWLFGGKQRSYHPKWGIWGPIDVGHEQVFEVFGRVSYTRGNDDISSANELVLLTLGGNWYYRQFRVSTNLIYGETERDVSDQGDGLALALRLQYLF